MKDFEYASFVDEFDDEIYSNFDPATLTAISTGVGELSKIGVSAIENKNKRNIENVELQKELKLCSKGKDVRGIFGKNRKRDLVSKCKEDVKRLYEQKQNIKNSQGDREFELKKQELQSRLKREESIIRTRNTALIIIPSVLVVGLIAYFLIKKNA